VWCSSTGNLIFLSLGFWGAQSLPLGPQLSRFLKFILILLSGIDVREKLARQRQLLNARLGLDVAVKIGIDMSEIFSTEDLTISLEADVTRHDPLRVSLCKDLSAYVDCVATAF
jgi:hypothetical protein